MMEDVCERRDHLTIWLHLDIKKEVYVHWETNERFRHYRLMNRANRASAKSSKYTGGSVTFMKTNAKLLMDRDTTIMETFKYTHTLKENKERFAYQRSTDHFVSKHHVI
ncbi:hypothetical protein Ahy_A04g019690 [Arachis hypogaea]|uniref:Protein FAR1-RELATED SEQUENCE n=1 Tax=Arachis hypogaea TaxID=3818 RepID=A0A445DGE0_ARAHY|nr:hypothetical protein Ahy_A04g019690 [Arachis hypogaea]